METILAMGLLLIIAITFLPLFINSTAGIFSVGHKQQAIGAIQKVIENNLSDHQPVINSHMNIEFSQAGISVIVPGELMTVREDYSRGNVHNPIELKAFIPEDNGEE